MECWSHSLYSAVWSSSLLGRSVYTFLFLSSCLLILIVFNKHLCHLTEVNYVYYSTCNLVFIISASFFFFLSTTESEQGVAQAILRGIIDFKREPWPNISETAKNLVRQMLEPDPKRRLTAKQVLGT